MKNLLRIILITIFILAGSYATYTLHHSPKIGVDDANIFFSYAENLTSGNGATYGNNMERVEGFSSMLWMLLCAMIFLIGLHEGSILILSVFLLLITQLVFCHAIHRFSKKKNQSSLIPLGLYGFFILISPAYFSWMSITLMDTCLWGLFLALMSYIVVYPPRSRKSLFFSTIPFVFSPIVRPEGMLIAPVMIGILWLRLKSEESRIQRIFCKYVIICFFLLLFVLTAFRLLYFGYPFPNTFYAKVSPSLFYDLKLGLIYFSRFLLLNNVITGGLVASVFVVAVSYLLNTVGIIKKETIRSIDTSGTAAVISLFLLGIPVLTGGDHFGMFRFFQPVYPLLCLTLIFFFIEHRKRVRICREKSAFIPFIVLLVFFLVGIGAPSIGIWCRLTSQSEIAHEFSIAESGVAHGEKLSGLFRWTSLFPRVGVISAGGFARTYDGYIIDLMGLNNEYIAHFKGDRKGMKNHAAFEKEAFFVVGVEPDILLASPPVYPKEENLYSVWLKGLFQDSRFTSSWSYGVLSHDREKHKETAFFKDSFLERVLSQDGYHFEELLIWSEGWRRRSEDLN